jgi:hypothetical protein
MRFALASASLWSAQGTGENRPFEPLAGPRAGSRNEGGARKVRRTVCIARTGVAGNGAASGSRGSVSSRKRGRRFTLSRCGVVLAGFFRRIWLRRDELHVRPLGYGPNELLLLHTAEKSNPPGCAALGVTGVVYLSGIGRCYGSKSRPRLRKRDMHGWSREGVPAPLRQFSARISQAPAAPRGRAPSQGDSRTRDRNGR